jgi:hypothetical protein
MGIKIKKNLIVPLIIIIFTSIFIFFTDYNVCFVKRTFGIPCPGCGLTRSFKNLFLLDFKKAIHYHPLFFLPILIMVIIFYSKLKKINLSNLKYLFMFFTLILIIVWIIRMILYFPDTPPMDYNYNSILYKIYSLIKGVFH